MGRWLKTGWLLLPILLLSACIRDGSDPSGEMREIPFRTLCGPEVRSVLTSRDIETKRTSVTLAAYRGGVLETARFFSGDGGMTLRLGGNRTYTVYAFINMGDLTPVLPGREEDLATVHYTVPDYRTLDRTGLPMAGRTDSFRVGDGSTGTIPVRRLFAKVTASLHCDWDGASVEKVRIKRLNGRIPLMGPAAAATEADLLDWEEMDTGSGPDGTYVFYVPENRQGTIPGITDPSSKAPDRNSSVKARESLLTFLEAEVRSTGAYGGTVLFRSFLGNNATDDFDIEGNVDYRWTIHYHEDGLQENSWKTDTDGLKDQRYLEWTGNPIRVQAGKTYAFADYLSTNIPLQGIVKTFSGEGKDAMIASAGTETFTIRADAAYGTKCLAEAKPLRNCTPALTRTTTFKVTDSRFIRWHGQEGNPVKEILISEAERGITDGDPLLLTGFEMGDETGTWSWKGKRIHWQSGLNLYLDSTIPPTITNGKGTITAYFNYGTDQENCFNAREYPDPCGVLTLIHPYADFVPGVHDILLHYKDDPECAITLRLNILPAGGEVTYRDVYTLVPEEATIEAGETQSFSLTAETYRYIDGRYDGSWERDAEFKEMTWTSSDSAVATVDADGTATGLDEGTATIRVRFRENGKLVYEEASATLHVTRGWKSEYELAIEPERADLLVGSTRKFIVTLTTRRYLDGVLKSTESTVLDNASLSWRSDAPSIVSVQSGEATGLKPGTATISATYKIGGKTLSVQSVITVKENNGININSGWDRSGTVILN